MFFMSQVVNILQKYLLQYFILGKQKDSLSNGLVSVVSKIMTSNMLHPNPCDQSLIQVKLRLLWDEGDQELEKRLVQEELT
jgi:hypothetical protein